MEDRKTAEQDYHFLRPLKPGEPDPSTRSKRAGGATITPFMLPDPRHDQAARLAVWWPTSAATSRATVAPGGAGKSSLTIVEALAMATGRDLLGVKPRSG